MKSIVKSITLFIRWGLGAISLVVGLIALLAGSLVPALLIASFGLLLTPLSNKYLFDKLKWTVPTWVKTILSIALFIGFFSTLPPVEPRPKVESAATQNTKVEEKTKKEIPQTEEENTKQKEAEEEKKRQKQEEQARIEAENKAKQDEERKRKEEEAAQKAQAEEEKLNSLATQYCTERESRTTRSYPIPDIVTNTDGEIEYKQNDERKKGANLTQNDCRTIIDYFNWFNDNYGQVENIDVQKVIERKYWIGMNIAELSSSMGWPNDINTMSSGSGKMEQWIYYKDSYGVSAYYFYVEGGKVTSYQDF